MGCCVSARLHPKAVVPVPLLGASCARSPCLQIVASSGDDGSVKFWDVPLALYHGDGASVVQSLSLPPVTVDTPAPVPVKGKGSKATKQDVICVSIFSTGTAVLVVTNKVSGNVVKMRSLSQRVGVASGLSSVFLLFAFLGFPRGVFVQSALLHLTLGDSPASAVWTALGPCQSATGEWATAALVSAVRLSPDDRVAIVGYADGFASIARLTVDDAVVRTCTRVGVRWGYGVLLPCM